MRKIEKRRFYRRFFVGGLPASPATGVQRVSDSAASAFATVSASSRPRAAAPRPAARPATAARPAAADPTRSTGRSCSCCAAPSDRDGCGPRGTSPSPAPARSMNRAHTECSTLSRNSRGIVAVGQRDRPAVGELDARARRAHWRGHVRTAARRQPGCGRGIRYESKLSSTADVAAEACRQRAPRRCGPSRRSPPPCAAQDRGRLHRDLCLSGSTTASSRTRSVAAAAAGAWMSGMLGAMAISSVSASRQAEGGGGAGAACSAGLSVCGGRLFCQPRAARTPVRGLGRTRPRQRHRRRAQASPAQLRASLPRTGRPRAPRRRRRRRGRARPAHKASASAAAAVTIGRSPQARAAKRPFAACFPALKFMAIP